MRLSELKSVLQASGTLTLVSYGERALGLIAQLALVRFVLPGDYGSYTSASFASLAVSFVAASGSSVIVLAGFGGSEWQGVAAVFSRAQRFLVRRSLYAMGAVILLMGLGAVFPKMGWFPLVGILGCGVVIEGVLGTFRFALLAGGRTRSYSVTTLVFAGLRIAGLLVGAVWTRSALGATLGGTAGSLVSLGVIVAIAWITRGKSEANPVRREPIRDSMWIAVSGLFAFLYFRQDLWILQSLGSREATASFSLFLRFHEIILALPAAYASIALRDVSRLQARGEVTKGSVRRILIGGAVVGVAGFAAAMAARLLDFASLFGKAYRQVPTLLGMSGWLYLPLGLSLVLQALLYSTGRARRVTWSLLMAVGLNLSLNLWLVPHEGANGAAVAKVLSECALVVSLAWGWGTGEVDQGSVARSALACAVATPICAFLVSWRALRVIP